MTANTIWLDHVAHMVPDLDEACTRLEAMGFFLSPLSLQSAPPAPGEAPVPTGTANRCVMLKRGYIEVLGKVAEDTPSVESLMANVARYVGVHLVAYGSDEVAARVTELEAAGFAPTRGASPQREVATEDGSGIARFSLAVPPRAMMPEAGMFFVRHETRELVWQPRFIRSTNGVTALVEVMMQVVDLEEAKERYARFLSVAPETVTPHCVSFEIGGCRVSLLAADRAGELLQADLPQAPCVVGYVLETEDMGVTLAAVAKAGGVSCEEAGLVKVSGGPALGAEIFICEPGTTPSWRRMAD